MTRAKEDKRKPNSVRLLELLAERPQNSADLQANSGLDQGQVHDALWNLRKRGMATSNKARADLAVYTITQKGLYRLMPATDPARIASAKRSYQKKLARNTKYRRAKGIAERAARPPKPERAPKRVAEPKVLIEDFPVEQRIVPAPAVADSIVSTAIQSRPAFQAAWC